MAKRKKASKSENSFYQSSPKEVIDKLKSRKEGLSEEEAQKRLEKEGPNRLPRKKSYSSLKILLEQFKSPLVYILVLAGVVTLFLGEYTDAIVIFGAVFLNTSVGFFQERKASKALESLKNVLTVEAVVKRDGREKEVPQEDLVPGDIVILTAGDKVPADARLISADNLKINEAALTGEWKPAKKDPQVINKETPLADRKNMVYMGTSVEDGEAKAVVVETGTDTELGRIATMVSEEKEEKTPYQKRLAHFSKVVGGFIGLVCVGIFIEGVIMGGEVVTMFETAVAIAVAAIPEGLPVAMTVILAIGMQRILKREGLVRKLVSAETLGSTSIICTDKTGTLTEAKMTTEAVYNCNGEKVDSQDSLHERCLEIGVFSNEAFLENPEAKKEDWELHGNPTEKAILSYAQKQGLGKGKLLSESPQVGRVPFSSSYKYSASLNKREKKYQLSAMGAPETILKRSKYYLEDGEKKKISSQKEKEIKEANEKLTSKGLRVVAVGYKKVNKSTNKLDLREQTGELVFAGFIGLHDPIREDVKESIATCRRAGMRPIVVTGDHKLTAKSVAEKLGFKPDEDEIITGDELAQLTDREFEEVFQQIEIYARVEPAQKMRIVKAWQDKGEVVAMTGDGVNDAPAIKRADVGVAQGSGTDVAQEVSDLVLLNDSFSIIVAAIEEGRAILDNIRKVITYLLSDSFTEIILVGFSILTGYPLPLTAVQILWINLAEDGAPSVALAFEPKESGLMDRKPKSQDTPLLNREMKQIIFVIGLVTDLLLLGIFWALLKFSGYELAHVQTIMFAALGVDSTLYLFSCRSLRKNIWQINLFSNRLLVAGALTSFLLVVAGVYVPILQTLLGTQALPLFDWSIIMTKGVLVLIGIELIKWHWIVKHQES